MTQTAERRVAEATASGVAALGMYEFAGMHGANDRLWAAIRRALRAAGINAPEALTRNRPAETIWADPGLVLAQTCGLPYALGLRDRVALIGTPDYGLEGCPPGHYRSAIVVRRDDPRDALAAFRGAVLAVNGTGSQSGFSAILCATVPLLREGRFFAATTVTGSHAQSIRAVASGRAEIAAIDAVTWRLVGQSLPEVAALRVLAWTEPTPGLPLISGQTGKAPVITAAVAEALESLEGCDRAALGIQGLTRFAPADYAPLAERFRAASAAHGLKLP